MNGKDTDFDQRMIDLFGEVTPPDEVLGKINPWSKPISLITWGFILTTMHLNFLYLQYILPSMGVIFIFLGFRSLREENKYFKIAWILSIVKLLLNLAYLFRDSTPLISVESTELTVAIFLNVFQIAIFLFYHAALQDTYNKAGRVMEGLPLIWLSLWVFAVFFLAQSPLSSSWFVVIPLVIWYIVNVQSLYRIGEGLKDTGYFIINAPIKINSVVFGWTYLLIALTTVLTCNAFSNHLKLEPQEYQLPLITEERQLLLDMDFPLEALQHLGNEDVVNLSDAMDIQVFGKVLMFDPKKVVHEDTSENYTQITHTYEPGKSNVEATTVYIEMPENVVYVMQYFTWKEGQALWQDGILISGGSETEEMHIISSGLFYNKKGIEYTAPFPRLVNDNMARNTMFGYDSSKVIAGAFSYPFGSENQRGYVLYRYTVMADSDIFFTHNILSYIHSKNPLHIPYERTEDLILNGAYTFEDELQQHSTSYDSKAQRKR